jgi:L-seryl-tRNA(Ser) seleniumtransferase
MLEDSLYHRRAFMKFVGALPLLAYIGAKDALDKAFGAVGKTAKDNIYSRIGIRPFINGRGTWTYLSGSLELPEVKAAKQAAAGHFVDIFELQHAVGRRLAELSGAEFGMVTSGAAGAIASSTAACIAGSDPAHIWQLPDTTGLKHEVIMFGGRSAFDSAVRLTGGKLVIARTHEEMKDKINDKTAMIYTTSLGERLEKAIVIAKDTKVPLLMDDAAGIPPIENLKLYAKMGCDLYCFSGGKGLRGPQCAGILLGRKDLIEAAMLNTSPWEGAVCRPMKVGKEEVMGMLAAVEAWTKVDLSQLNKEWGERAERIQKLVDTVPGVKTEIRIPEGGNRYPTLSVTWDEEAWNFTVADCDRKLREGEPRIEVLTASNPSLVPAVAEGDKDDKKTPRRRDRIQIISMTLQPGEDLVVGKRLRDILNQARKGAKA